MREPNETRSVSLRFGLREVLARQDYSQGEGGCGERVGALPNVLLLAEETGQGGFQHLVRAVDLLYAIAVDERIHHLLDQLLR